MGDKPSHRLITKPAGQEKFIEIGAGWQNAKGQVSLSFKEAVAPGSKALLVKNEPKPTNG